MPSHSSISSLNSLTMDLGVRTELTVVISSKSFNLKFFLLADKWALAIDFGALLPAIEFYKDLASST